MSAISTFSPGCTPVTIARGLFVVMSESGGGDMVSIGSRQRGTGGFGWRLAAFDS